MVVTVLVSICVATVLSVVLALFLRVELRRQRERQINHSRDNLEAQHAFDRLFSPKPAAAANQPFGWSRKERKESFRNRETVPTQMTFAQETTGVDAKTSIALPQVPEMSPKHVPEVIVFDLRPQLVGKVLTDDTRLFLEDRLEDLVLDGPSSDDQIVQWGLNAATLFDEAGLLQNHVSREDWQVIESILDGLREKMSELKLCLIDEDDWNPARQRAVSVVRRETACVARVLKKRSCGLTFNGRFVKKQEVEIEMPFESHNSTEEKKDV